MSLTRSLTLPLTRALSHAELTQKLGGSFSPYSLNPYLLFDARDSMIGTLENPTLDLNPALPETLDVITAVRAGVATYTDESGLIQSATANTVRVDQTQGAELTPTKFQKFVNTDFNESYWSFISGVSPVYNYDTAPNGEQDALRVVSTGGAWPQINETVQNLTIGQQYTASFYVKSDGTSQIQQSTHFTGLSGGVSFTPTANWERISYTITATATSHNFVIFTNNGSAPASSYLIYGPQLEEGTTASSFVANTTGSPKFITGATYGPRVPMMLIEPSATNLVANSTSFTENVDLTKTTGIDAPDGTNTASKISGILSSSSSDMAYSIASTVTSSTQVTGSIYVRGIAGEVVVLRIKRYTGGAYVASGPQTVTLTGDWQRVEGLTMTLGADNTNAGVSIRKESGSTADSVDLWGGQIEAGSVATSYIPTSGSAVTRAADDLVISGSAFSDFFSTTENTFYCEFDPRPSDEGRFLLCAQASSTRFIYQGGSNNNWYIYDGTLSSVFGTESSTGLQRAAATFDGTSKEASLNGGIENTSSHNGNLLNIPTELRLGKAYYGGGYLNGHIKRVIWWPSSSDRL